MKRNHNLWYNNIAVDNEDYSLYFTTNHMVWCVRQTMGRPNRPNTHQPIHIECWALMYLWSASLCEITDVISWTIWSFTKTSKHEQCAIHSASDCIYETNRRHAWNFLFVCVLSICITLNFKAIFQKIFKHYSSFVSSICALNSISRLCCMVQYCSYSLWKYMEKYGFFTFSLRFFFLSLFLSLSHPRIDALLNDISFHIMYWTKRFAKRFTTQDKIQKRTRHIVWIKE